MRPLSEGLFQTRGRTCSPGDEPFIALHTRPKYAEWSLIITIRCYKSKMTSTSRCESVTMRVRGGTHTASPRPTLAEIRLSNLLKFNKYQVTSSLMSVRVRFDGVECALIFFPSPPDPDPLRHEIPVNLDDDLELFQYQISSLFGVDPADQIIAGLNLLQVFPSPLIPLTPAPSSRPRLFFFDLNFAS